MRDINVFLNSLVNIDRNSLVAILVSEAEAAGSLSVLRDSAPHHNVPGGATLNRVLLVWTGCCRSSSTVIGGRWQIPTAPQEAVSQMLCCT